MEVNRPQGIHFLSNKMFNSQFLPFLSFRTPGKWQKSKMSQKTYELLRHFMIIQKTQNDEVNRLQGIHTLSKVFVRVCNVDEIALLTK